MAVTVTVSGLDVSVQFSVPAVPPNMSGDCADFTAWIVRDTSAESVLRCTWLVGSVQEGCDIPGVEWITRSGPGVGYAVPGDAEFSAEE